MNSDAANTTWSHSTANLARDWSDDPIDDASHDYYYYSMLFCYLLHWQDHHHEVDLYCQHHNSLVQTTCRLASPYSADRTTPPPHHAHIISMQNTSNNSSAEELLSSNSWMLSESHERLASSSQTAPHHHHSLRAPSNSMTKVFRFLHACSISQLCYDYYCFYLSRSCSNVDATISSSLIDSAAAMCSSPIIAANIPSRFFAFQTYFQLLLIPLLLLLSHHQQSQF